MSAAMTPIGGNATELASKARGLANTAALIQQAIDDLNKLSNKDDTISEAVDKVRGKAKDLAGSVTKAHVRFKGTADALLDYSGHLETAQSDANSAIAAYQQAIHSTSGAQSTFNTQSAQWAHDNNQTYYDGMPDVLNGYLQTPAGVQAKHHLDTANAAVTAAETRWNNAINYLDAAAKSAISKINDAISDSGLNDSFWDGLGAMWDGFVSWAKKYLAPVLDIIQKIAEQIGNIAGFLAMIVGILGVFFPALEALAGALELISLAAAAISFLATLALVGLGDRTWGDLIVTGITLVTSALGVKIPKMPGLTSVLGKADVFGKLGESVAGKAAVAAQDSHLLQAGFKAQSYIAGATNWVVGQGTDQLVDGVAENAGSGLDAATGQERPDGLWPDPIGLTPSVVPNVVAMVDGKPAFDAGVANPSEVNQGAADWQNATLHALGSTSFVSPAPSMAMIK